MKCLISLKYVALRSLGISRIEPTSAPDTDSMLLYRSWRPEMITAKNRFDRRTMSWWGDEDVAGGRSLLSPAGLCGCVIKESSCRAHEISSRHPLELWHDVISRARQLPRGWLPGASNCDLGAMFRTWLRRIVVPGVTLRYGGRRRLGRCSGTCSAIVRCHSPWFKWVTSRLAILRIKYPAFHFLSVSFFLTDAFLITLFWCHPLPDILDKKDTCITIRNLRQAGYMPEKTKPYTVTMCAIVIIPYNLALIG